LSGQNDDRHFTKTVLVLVAAILIGATGSTLWSMRRRSAHDH